MKTLRHIQFGIISCLIITYLMGFFSCSDDHEATEILLPPTISKICIWNEDMEEWVIPEAGSKIRIGASLRIEGSHLAQTIAVYINGGLIPEFHAEDHAIELIIPDIPVDNEDIQDVNLNLIRVVNTAGAATCTADDFQFFGRQITVSGFSLTENDGRTWTAVEQLPIGGKIRIEGSGLKTARELYVNGMSVDLSGISSTERSDDFLIVTIPESLPFGNAVEDMDNRNKLRLVTAYDDRVVDCLVIGKQAEIVRITDENGKTITEAGRNAVVVIEGKYFATLQKLSFNDQELQPTLVESNRIVFTVPENADQFTVGEGELTIINAYDEIGVSYPFTLLGFVPNVTGISYTMPKPGNVIRLTGTNLYNKAKVYFPSSTGEKEGTVQSAASDATSLKVLVPDGVGDKAGYLRIESEGASIVVDGIVMFYKQGVFLKKFTDEELKFGNVTGSLTKSMSALYNIENRPENDTNPINPDYFIYFKNSSIPKDETSSGHGAYVRFSTYDHIKQLLETNIEISNSTLIKDVALQVDVYMPNPWLSGVLAWRMDKDGGTMTSNRIINLAPWTVGNPFDFDGEWHTFTYKLTDFALGETVKNTYTLAAWLVEYAMKKSGSTWKPCTSLLTFANGNFMRIKDASNQTSPADPQWECVPIENFEMGLANMRLVPLSPLPLQ